ncbi:response regulator transcription factor [Porphyrobacter sp. GA68]|uniref:response regulator transcription factor n=1 Tax=Porphyrobacter sp. GA68 TaxID=2883480 RepID=UPI001D18957D|nr:LuxR C-terminal-related transcriptional regulator [Porphyrobacter sp. GA68]
MFLPTTPLRGTALPHKLVVFLIDQDAARRHAVSQLLMGSSVVLPLESIAELATRWPEEGIALLADEADNLSLCMAAMEKDGVCMPVVCYAPQPSTSQMFAALSQDACGFFALPASPAEVSYELDQAVQRFEASRTAKEKKGRTLRCLAVLSKRERQVLELFIEGMCAKSSARALGLSPRTVELYRTNLTTKLGAQSLLQAAAMVFAAE